MIQIKKTLIIFLVVFGIFLINSITTLNADSNPNKKEIIKN